MLPTGGEHIMFIIEILVSSFKIQLIFSCVNILIKDGLNSEIITCILI